MNNQGFYTYQIGVTELESLFNYLTTKGHLNVGSTFRDGAIMLGELRSFSDLASGFTEQVGKGQYQVNSHADASLFQYSVGLQSFKKYLHPERRKLWSANKTAEGFEFTALDKPPKIAMWGVKSCDLQAMKVLDQIFTHDEVQNDFYAEVRQGTFIIAAGCTAPSANCFCTTQNAGPNPDAGFDFSLVEVAEGERYVYLASVGTARAEEIAKVLGFEIASQTLLDKGAALIVNATEKMKIRFDTEQVSKSLRQEPNHKHWDEVAKRCLSCANCTMVCPTCFCTSTEDMTDITGDHTERWLRWDSCFNGDFSFIHGGKIRSSTTSRYRQWLSHKLSNWYDQFGTSGCVGCGRCTTWCPVGIDLTEEVNELIH